MRSVRKGKIGGAEMLVPGQSSEIQGRLTSKKIDSVLFDIMQYWSKICSVDVQILTTQYEKYYTSAIYSLTTIQNIDTNQHGVPEIYPIVH